MKLSVFQTVLWCCTTDNRTPLLLLSWITQYDHATYRVMSRGVWNPDSTGFVVTIPKFQIYLFMTNVTQVTVNMHECTDEYRCSWARAHTHIHTQSNCKSLFYFGKPCLWVPVTTAWRILRLRMEERPPIWRVTANKLNKPLRTADKGWSSSLGVGWRTNNSYPWKKNC